MSGIPSLTLKTFTASNGKTVLPFSIISEGTAFPCISFGECAEKLNEDYLKFFAAHGKETQIRIQGKMVCNTLNGKKHFNILIYDYKFLR